MNAEAVHHKDLDEIGWPMLENGKLLLWIHPVLGATYRAYVEEAARLPGVLAGEVSQWRSYPGCGVQAVMSFHACGNNVGDNTYIPLPPWVRQCAEEDPAIFFRDRAGVANPECISLFADDTPCLAGRTPLQVSQLLSAALCHCIHVLSRCSAAFHALGLLARTQMGS